MPTNRKHGEGSVYFEESRQKWVASFFDALGKRHKKRFDDEKEARVYLIDQINEINKGSFIAPTNLTVGEWVIDWLKTYKLNTVRTSTYDYYSFLSTYLEPIAVMKMQDITAFHIQQLYQTLLDKISGNTTHKVHSLLKDLFKKALELDIIKKNIMDAVVPPHYEKKEIEIFTDADITKILKTCSEHPIFKKRYAAVLLATTTGLRKGEVLGLRVCDVLLDSDQVFIKKTLSRTSAGIVFSNPKTKSSVRKLGVIHEVTKQLRELIMTLPSREPEQLCFVTSTNNYITPTNFDKFWHRLLAHADVEYKKFHTLRHTYATRLLASGEPIAEVSRRLGHNKISHTLELYGHAMPDYDKTLVENTKNLYQLPV